jgi:hypothetical protein
MKKISSLFILEVSVLRSMTFLPTLFIQSCSENIGGIMENYPFKHKANKKHILHFNARDDGNGCEDEILTEIVFRKIQRENFN